MKHVSFLLQYVGLAALFTLSPTAQLIAQQGKTPQEQTEPSTTESPYDLSGKTIDPGPNELHILDKSFDSYLIAPTRTLPTQPRMIAEWEPVQGALIRYPLGISVNTVKIIASELKTYVLCSSSSQSSATSAFQNAGVNMPNIVFVTAPTDTYWTRDYGPWWITNQENGKRVVRMLDVVYRPNGERPNDDRVPSVVARALNLPTYFSSSFICQGGNVMTDSLHVGASTNRVQDENPNLSLSQIKQSGQTYMGFNPYYVMTDPAYPDDYIKHIDCWAKFIAPNKVLVKRLPSSDSHYSKFEEAANTWANQTDADGHPYQVIRIDGSFDSPYVNHIILNDRVFVPIMTSETNPADKTALDQIQAAYGGSYRVIGVKAASGLPWLGTDSIHCRVNSIPVFSGLFDQDTGLTFTNQPLSQTVTEGATVSFNVTVAGGTTPYSYQWYKNDAAVNGATSTVYTFTAQASDNNASLYVVVSDSSSPEKTVTSSTATLTVTSGGGGGDASIFNEVESNDSRATANAVPDIATKIVGTIGTSTDQDYFKVNVSTGETLKVDMTGPAKDYDLYLFDNSGTQLAKSTGSTATESVTYKNTGTATVYYIQVKGYNGAYTTTTPYQLALTLRGGSDTWMKIHPSIATLSVGGTKQFMAIAGDVVLPVTWTCTGGTISTNGLYTAPELIGTYTVTATSKDNPASSASATVTVTSANDDTTANEAESNDSISTGNP